MENKSIQSLWIGSELSTVEQLTIKSFLKHGHDFHLYVYDLNIKGCPHGTKLKDANQVIPNSMIFKDILGTYASFADWFRYKMLYENGGWWVDMDVICIKKFDFPLDYCFTTERTFDQNSNSVVIANNAVMKSPKGADYLLEMLEYMGEQDLTRSERRGEYGPIYLDAVLKGYESEMFIQPPNVFCKINWNEIDVFFVENPNISFDDSYAVHLWNDMWSRNGFDKNSSFSPNSIIEWLKRQYL